MLVSIINVAWQSGHKCPTVNNQLQEPDVGVDFAVGVGVDFAVGVGAEGATVAVGWLICEEDGVGDGADTGLEFFFFSESHLGDFSWGYNKE